MENILQIQTLTKKEFKSIIEEVIKRHLASIKESDKPENLTVQSCAELLSVSDLTIYNYIKRGVIPAKRIGRKYIINSLELEEVLKRVKSLKYQRDV